MRLKIRRCFLFKFEAGSSSMKKGKYKVSMISGRESYFWKVWCC